MKLFNRKPQDQYYSQNSSVSSDKLSKLKGISSTLALLFLAPALALILTAHVFQSYEVDGDSMETTLQNSDRLIVNKFSKTLSNLSGNDYIPNRHDVVVFDRPVQSSISRQVDHLIKRVIALPGERVTVTNGTVTVFNQEFPDGFNPDQGREYMASVSATEGEVDITVGSNEIFVLGDNRFNSTDSRRFGSINVDSLVGPVEFRFIPINNTKKL